MQTQPFIDTINITRDVNKNKHHLYVLGYLMQEVGEFTEAVLAIRGQSKFIANHPHHDIEEGADVIQNVFSHLAMLPRVAEFTNAEYLVQSCLDHMDSISDDRDTAGIPIANTTDISDNLAMVQAAVGRFAESTMIVSGDITHKGVKHTPVRYHAAVIINNVFVTLKSNHPELSNEELQMMLLDWTTKKNQKWLSVISSAAE